MGGGHAPGGAVVGATVALTIAAGIVTVLRLLSRLVIVRKPGLDDVFIVIAMVLTVALTITMCEQVNYGVGRHYDTLSDNDKNMSQKWFYASIWIYYLGLGSVKTSILLQYLRIFPHNRFRLACFIMIGIIFIYTCWTFFSAIFACTPIAYFWNPSLKGHCLNRLAVWFANAAGNIITDIATAILPLPVLKTLALPKRQKFALMAVFGLAGLTCIISILRLQSLYAVSIASDITWENPLAALWSNMEVNIGILCACIPTLKGCVTHFFPRLFGDVRSASIAAGTPNGRSNGISAKTPSKSFFSETGRRGQKSANDGEGDNSIHIVTVLQQEVERGDMTYELSENEGEDTLKLVPGPPGYTHYQNG